MEGSMTNYKSALMCLSCGSGELNFTKIYVSCLSCGNQYPITDDKIITTKNYIQAENWEIVGDGFDLFKGNEKFIKTDRISGPRISQLRDMLKVQGLAINLGSGKDNHAGFVNIDLGEYEHVDVIADLANVPFESGSIELAVSNSVLEHIYDYNAVIDEVHRLLQVGGYFYLCVPNACIRHHKFDYHRWTTPALHKLVEDRFEILDSGSCRGIAYSLITYVNALMTYKIRNKKLLTFSRWLWGVVSYPLFWIREDHHNPEYQAMSQTIYVLGRKL